MKALLSRHGPPGVAMLLLLICSACSPRLGKLAELCAEHFPVKDSTRIEERIVTDTVLLPDTYVQYIDSTECPPNLSEPTTIVKEIKVPVPGQKVVVQVPCQDRIIMRRDSAMETVLRNQVAKLQKELAKTEKRQQRQSKSLLWWLIVLLGGLVAYRLLRKK